jgi:DNA-binding transcriptional ArsR family regulator
VTTARATGGRSAPDPDRRADEVFAALADGSRRDILRSIATTGPHTTTELAADREITRQAVAKHLRVLDRAGLVHGRREGREVRYEADLEPLTSATAWIHDTGASWDRRLGRLATVLRDRAAGPATD